MENNELTLLELNEGVSSGRMQPRPHDGDALAREEATALSEKLQKIAGFPLMPWQESYLNAAYDAAAKGIRASVTLPPARRHA